MINGGCFSLCSQTTLIARVCAAKACQLYEIIPVLAGNGLRSSTAGNKLRQNGQSAESDALAAAKCRD